MLYRLRKRGAMQAGLAPGTLVHIGRERAEAVKVSMLEYTREQFRQEELQTVEECFVPLAPASTRWINVDGIHQLDVIEKLGAHYQLHPLALEDVVNTEQRPKLDDYEDYLFVVVKMFFYHEDTHALEAEQVSLFVKDQLVISFQERAGDAFDPIRERLKNGKGKIRKQGADYLAYALIDAIVDHYFVIMESLGERVEEVQEQLIGNPDSQILRQIHTLKREMLFLRKSVWPLREVINGLLREESPLIHKDTVLYLRDVYDHTIQVIDAIETFRDMLSSMVDLYLSSVSNKMNEVMKVLTIIATIFIPLTFIAGVYGMNWHYMPELRWHWGYFTVLGVMAAIAIGMLIYFKRKKWL